MIRALLNMPPWRLVVFTAGMAPLTIWAGSRWGETGGGITLASLLVPVACVALSGRVRWSILASAIVAVGVFWEVALSGGLDGGDGLSFATVSSLSVFSMAAVVAASVRLLRQQLAWHREELQVSINGEWDDLTSSSLGQADPASLSACDINLDNETGEIDFPMLLLTIQDIGRRISMNLDLNTLIPAIISTARSALDCKECRVYLWDRSAQELFNPLPDRPRDTGVYVPSPDHGIGAWVMQERQILVKEDLETDHDLQVVAASESHVPAAVAPLVVGSDLVGLLVIDRLRASSCNLVRMLYTLSSIYALGIKNAQLFRRVEELALRDGLTGLLNHATFQRKIRMLMRETLNSGGTFSLIMGDADRFKLVNDTYGHQAGDEVLREVGRLWQLVMPEGTILARYGGEEFIAALPATAGQEAMALAESLRRTIESHSFLHEGRELRVTSSFGVAEFRGPDQLIDDVVREADHSLMTAKKSGRNRVIARQLAPVDAVRKPN